MTTANGAKPKRFLKPKEVQERVGFKASAIAAWEKAGTFPKRIKFGTRAIRHLESEIDEWMAKREAARDVDTAATAAAAAPTSPAPLYAARPKKESRKRPAPQTKPKRRSDAHA